MAKTFDELAERTTTAASRRRAARRTRELMGLVGRPGMTLAIRRAKSTLDEADRRLTALARIAFPVGSRAAWRHGDAVRRGTVVEAAGWDFGSLKFRIRSAASGRAYWIGAEKLLSYASCG